MGTYNSAVITTAGQSLLARAIADSLPFYFSSAKTTEYVVPTGTSAASLTELPNIKQSEEITSATVSGGNQVATSVRFDNTEITLNYSINTIGVYARVGTDTEETLLAVITAITADVMPSYSAANPVSYVYSINLAISNASNINIIVAPTGVPNYAEFNELSAEVEALDAEVQNARIGADGVTYPTLGDAIRTNDSALKNALSQIGTLAYSKNLYNGNAILEGYWMTSTGELDSTHPDYGGYVTEEIPVESGKDLYISRNNGGRREAGTCTRCRTLNGSKQVVRVLNTVSHVAIRSGEVYIQFLFANAQKTTELQIEYDKITSYEAWFTPYYKKCATADDFNELNNDFFSAIEKKDSINLIDPDAWQDGLWIEASGEITSSHPDYGGTVITVPVDRKPLFLTHDDDYTALLATVRYITQDADESLIAVHSGTINGFVPEENTKFISICIGQATRDTNPTLTYTIPMGYLPYTEEHLEPNESVFYNYATEVGVGMFDTIGAIGDSYTQGSVYNSNGVWSQHPDHAYIAIMGKRFGIPYSNYGLGGANTRTYQTDADGLQKVLSDDAKDFYMFALGINDAALGTSYIGTSADIDIADYTHNADTFYGNYGKIIQQVKAHAPNAKMVMVKTMMRSGTKMDQINDAIASIAAIFSMPCIDPYDDPFFSSRLWSFKTNSHPTLPGYCGAGLALERLLSKTIMNNPEYFLYSTVG